MSARARARSRIKTLLALALLITFFYRERKTHTQEDTHTERTISVVVPSTCDDYECFFGVLLASVFSLTTHPLELIVITSGCAAIKGVDEPVRDSLLSKGIVFNLVHLPVAQNQARSRNLGAMHSSGSYIFFFDMDDRLHSGALDLLHQTIVTFPQTAGFVFTHAQHGGDLHADIEPYCQLARSKFCPRRQPSTALRDRLFSHWFSKDLKRPTWCCVEKPLSGDSWAPGWLIVKRRTFLLNGAYDDTLDIGEDGNLIARLLQGSKDVVFIDQPLGYYNQNHDNPPCQAW
jgi:glycosyltransferase involved in cell wall biosynthesis